MSTPDPDPRHTAGLDGHRTLRRGDTPPAEGGISGISHPEPPELRHAWGPAPLITVAAVIVVLIVVAIVLAFVL
ncbi:DUF6480 family protein [Kitasatospora sp. NPDC127111]|uniref:DUF6480 family protein n=1 Tax=Kitasatospora sp. NPDC127111 TaxID=3345363 RepID=UPI003640DD22